MAADGENLMRQEPLQIEPGLRWYAIRTKVNREKDVERRLSDLRLEVFLPWMRARRRMQVLVSRRLGAG